jgi:diguanylate cyclase (GGDEF)-like protein
VSTTAAKPLQRELFQQLVEGMAEPVIVARVDRPDWPVVLCNAAFAALSGDKPAVDRPLADVIEQLIGRELALEVSETVRRGHENTVPVELARREYLLVLKPLAGPGDSAARYYAAYWRRVAAGTGDKDLTQELARARRRIRDLSRDDAVTGLLNEAAFREVLAHDWAVAAREQSRLALVGFSLDYFEAYVEVFGRHASDSCLRRVAQAVRRCLKRASDVAARITTPGGDLLVVLSHASDEEGVRQFALRIGGAVRELGLHHPRSRVGRFVTVTPQIELADPHAEGSKAERFLERLLAGR